MLIIVWHIISKIYFLLVWFFLGGVLFYAVTVKKNVIYDIMNQLAFQFSV